MPHVLITGMTESGKSTLAKMLASLRRKQNRGILVLDPMLGSGKPWDAEFITRDQVEFLRMVWASESCDVFVDEAGRAIGHYNDLMIQLATEGRHYATRKLDDGTSVYGGGHNCYFMCQRAAMVSPTIRTQCRILFAFNQALEDASVLAKEYGYDELKECPRLAQGEYFQVQRFKGITKGKVF